MSAQSVGTETQPTELDEPQLDQAAGGRKSGELKANDLGSAPGGKEEAQSIVVC